MNLIVEVWKNDCSVELNFYYGISKKQYHDILFEHKNQFFSGKYKKFDHVVNFDNEPDRIVVELMREVE